MSQHLQQSKKSTPDHLIIQSVDLQILTRVCLWQYMTDMSTGSSKFFQYFFNKLIISAPCICLVSFTHHTSSFPLPCPPLCLLLSNSVKFSHFMTYTRTLHPVLASSRLCSVLWSLSFFFFYLALFKTKTNNNTKLLLCSLFGIPWNVLINYLSYCADEFVYLRTTRREKKGFDFV